MPCIYVHSLAELCSVKHKVHTINRSPSEESNKDFHQKDQTGVVKNGLLTAQEASKYLGVSIRYFYSLKATYHLKHYKTGKRCIRYRVADLDAFINQFSVEVNKEENGR